MPKVRRNKFKGGYREPSLLSDRIGLAMCDFSPTGGSGSFSTHPTHYEAWEDWQQTRERRISECIEQCGPGTRPYAFWAWDYPDVNAKRKDRESDVELLRRCGLLPKDEEQAIRAAERDDKSRPPYLQTARSEATG